MSEPHSGGVDRHGAGEPANSGLSDLGFVRGLLYALLVATPVTAIAGAWLEGHPLTLGILGDVPPMIPEAHTAGQAIAQIHTILGDAVVWLAGEESRIAYIHRLRRAVVHAEQ